MNILIICSWFPPDTAISAVRPYMFAKYLSNAGHHVRVLRLGEFDRKPDESNLYPTESFEVISALGSNCPVERFLRSDRDDASYQEESQEKTKSKLIRRLNKSVSQRSALRLIYNSIHDLTKAKANS